MKIEQKLLVIQQKLNVPKGNYNSFGKYSYRSCEDILEAVKPLLAETKTVLTVTDDMVAMDGRFYIKATARLADTESDEVISNTAFARESEAKKGMDESQVTGSTSSYARKYALNGLFCIDDVKDADTRDNREEDQKKRDEVAKQTIDSTKAESLRNRCKKLDVNVEKLCQMYGVKTFEELTEEQLYKINGQLNKAEKEKKE